MSSALAILLVGVIIFTTVMKALIGNVWAS